MPEFRQNRWIYGTLFIWKNNHLVKGESERQFTFGENALAQNYMPSQKHMHKLVLPELHKHCRRGKRDYYWIAPSTLLHFWIAPERVIFEKWTCDYMLHHSRTSRVKLMGIKSKLRDIWTWTASKMCHPIKILAWCHLWTGTTSQGNFWKFKVSRPSAKPSFLNCAEKKNEFPPPKNERETPDCGGSKRPLLRAKFREHSRFPLEGKFFPAIKAASIIDVTLYIHLAGSGVGGGCGVGGGLKSQIHTAIGSDTAVHWRQLSSVHRAQYVPGRSSPHTATRNWSSSPFGVTVKLMIVTYSTVDQSTKCGRVFWFHRVQKRWSMKHEHELSQKCTRLLSMSLLWWEIKKRQKAIVIFGFVENVKAIVQYSHREQRTKLCLCLTSVGDWG